MSEPLLKIEGLSLSFPTYRGAVQALRSVDLTVGEGEIVGLVGESGCGKSVTAMAATRLLPKGRYHVSAGRIRMFGKEVLALPEREMQEMRGALVSTIFQEPMNALNPAMRIGAQMIEVIRQHRQASRAEARATALDLLADMRISEPERTLEAYSFELSGGMRQRVLIAMAFSCNPRLIFADEPTTALDVTIQAQILSLLRDKARQTGAAVLFVSHDMAVVGQLCDRVAVMYAGRIVEEGATKEILDRPAHPYTQGLLRCLPERAAPKRPLKAIPGSVLSLIDPPPGCSFRQRCEAATPICERDPPPVEISKGRSALCWFAGGGDFTERAA
jgi:peptide/nickel transport system ATP-binding protein